jgi:pimeloyl-ACP methyl ester carboxylesterase
MTETRVNPAELTNTTLACVGELTFNVASAGPVDGPPVVLLHGFPNPMLAGAQWRRC